MSAKTISIINNKGGAGKTATTTEVGEILASIGYKVLLVDMDEQSNLSMQFNRHKDTNNLIDNILTERYDTIEQVSPCIQETDNPNIDIIANYKERKSTVSMIILDTTKNNNIILKKALKTVKDQYDFILIDTAPASNILITNAMFASDYIITPVKAEENSYEGLETTMKNMKRIIDEFEIEIDFMGVFMTVVNQRTKNFRTWQTRYKEELGNKFFETYIRNDSKLEESQSMRVSLIEHDSSSRALLDYAHLVLEMNIMDEAHAAILKEAIGE